MLGHVRVEHATRCADSVEDWRTLHASVRGATTSGSGQPSTALVESGQGWPIFSRIDGVLKRAVNRGLVKTKPRLTSNLQGPSSTAFSQFSKRWKSAKFNPLQSSWGFDAPAAQAEARASSSTFGE